LARVGAAIDGAAHSAFGANFAQYNTFVSALVAKACRPKPQVRTTIR
jgi:hypothetical protein